MKVVLFHVLLDGGRGRTSSLLYAVEPGFPKASWAMFRSVSDVTRTGSRRGLYARSTFIALGLTSTFARTEPSSNFLRTSQRSRDRGANPIFSPAASKCYEDAKFSVSIKRALVRFSASGPHDWGRRAQNSHAEQKYYCVKTSDT